MAEMQHSAHARCDRCQAQGYTTWINGDYVLIFCGHHTRSYMDKLTAQGFTLLMDDTQFLAGEC